MKIRYQQERIFMGPIVAKKQEDECGHEKCQRKLTQEITDADGLTSALSDTLIERVYVYPGKQLNIEWKATDFLRMG